MRFPAMPNALELDKLNKTLKVETDGGLNIGRPSGAFHVEREGGRCHGIDVRNRT